MAKKVVNEEPAWPTEHELPPDPDDVDLSGTEQEDGAGLGDLDFNVDDEYKADPLIPKATYHGVVTKVEYVPKAFAIVWDVNLHDNGGVMNDSETPIDGATVQFKNWLPKPGDENIMTKKGNATKRQSKINIFKDFQTAMGISMATPTAIAIGLAEAQWIGLEVDVDVEIDEYNGKFRNSAGRMKKSTM